MKSNYLLCYDIRNPRRLASVYKCVKSRGLHIQYSVFICRFTWKELIQIIEELNSIIDCSEDDIRIYPLPADLKPVVMGCGDRIPEGVSVFLS
ncbi:CRISPR-associated endonuclease Cas2 [Candidatus Magnetominusculus xianensis]|uniref:CRISPR-associated endoribonuclease Cas2 n=1 Tax=Candidatus Magnetominusculus xianensis TaxID=1748249 RepID=A0ABR5SKR7_9BACT|nr:CRISPR-associated endonuclease Cas2 [Candidatus Magnetominusculus xianensis]KWT94945.1 CRISPR-associated endoribonuclease Cas2 [Candidatus Magnetominusculus xianensis]MBF0405191.1 CRISPR-associated endonuclease Cas2 [Nitrospirota bacterium]